MDEQMQQMMNQMQALASQVQAMAVENRQMQQNQAAANEAAMAREASLRHEVHAAVNGSGATTNGGTPNGYAGAGFGQGGEASALVSKWAPDQFSGLQEDWRVFALKFRSYVGAMLKGAVGLWMDYAKENPDSNCKSVAIAPEARAPAAMLYSSLIAVCEGKSIAIVERAGAGEGIEAWRLLLARYEAQTRQSKVIKMIQVLNWDFKQGDLLDQLETFDRACAKYTESTKKDLDDDTKIGIVIKGMDAGPLREHLLLHSERCVTYDEFRDEVDTIAKARASNLLTPAPHGPWGIRRRQGEGPRQGQVLQLW